VLFVGVVLFAVGAVIEAGRRRHYPDNNLVPDFLIYTGGAVATWMAAKLFWKEEPPEWFAIVVLFGWLVILAMTMNVIRRGVLS
jgi:hypothetical protein